ncbi:hypothetical protein F5Y12DRAFT_711006 [Xylaria sp. FL1777]|nr:hypothetical protein F5Y12DRAFT_711006 [Xylaria sp. FL1777]
MDPIQEIGFSTDLPSSPWATRFSYGNLAFTSQNVNHCPLAPVPRIDDPVYYDQDPLMPNLPHSDSDYDKALVCEKFQRDTLGGLCTWQSAALNRFLRFSPESGLVSAGHRLIDKLPIDLPLFSAHLPESSWQQFPLRTRPAISGTNEDAGFSVYQRERIKVDETQWFKFLRKERWLDWIGFTPDFTQEPRRRWSVDEPKIWEFLRVSIELVNRIFKSLIKDKHKGGI